MAIISESVDVDVTIGEAFRRWQRLEDFAGQLRGVHVALQLDDKHSYWIVSFAGRRKEWFACIVDEQPDKHIAWRSEEGTPNAGYVRFQAVRPDATRVTVKFEFEPDGVWERLGIRLGFVQRWLRRSLHDFKGLVETRDIATSEPYPSGWITAERAKFT